MRVGGVGTVAHELNLLSLKVFLDFAAGSPKQRAYHGAVARTHACQSADAGSAHQVEHKGFGAVLAVVAYGNCLGPGGIRKA